MIERLRLVPTSESVDSAETRAEVLVFPGKRENLQPQVEQQVLPSGIKEMISYLDEGVGGIYTESTRKPLVFDQYENRLVFFREGDYIFAYSGWDQNEPSERARILRRMPQTHPFASRILFASQQFRDIEWPETVQMVSYEGEEGQHNPSSKLQYTRQQVWYSQGEVQTRVICDISDTAETYMLAKSVMDITFSPVERKTL